MGTDAVVESLIPAKVHAGMCSELRKSVAGVSQILSEIEAARPGGASGMESLCLLNNGLAKAKSLLQNCSDSSVLYSALTGNAILSRCRRARNMMEQSLIQIQDLVPVKLAAKISGVVADLRSATFSLDAREEEAGKALQDLLHRYGSSPESMEEYALSVILTVASQLHLSSKKALLIEKRSIKRLLDKSETTSKAKILLFFLNLLKAYGSTLSEEPRISREAVELCSTTGYNRCESNGPPEEFICPLSARVMYDPVIIASGQTYERMWIQKWFDEGNDTCPKTNMNLPHLSFTSNLGLRDTISKWSATHNVSIPDPNPSSSSEAAIWEEMPTNSVSSLSSSLNDLTLRLDLGNVIQKKKPSEEFVSNLSKPSWDSKTDAVKDGLKLLRGEMPPAPEIFSQMNLLPPLMIGFLKDARDSLDMEAVMNGCLLLLELIQKHRMEVPSSMAEDLCDLLASFFDTDASSQALAVVEALSCQPEHRYEIARSNAMGGILSILDFQMDDDDDDDDDDDGFLLQIALSILRNLSSTNHIDHPDELIPKLVPLLEETTLSTHCILILKNLCERASGRKSVAETEGCISSVALLLEAEDRKAQEHAVSVLHSLCCHRANYREMVMKEGVIPGLVHVSVNGNRRAKATASEVLRVLKNEFSRSGEISGGGGGGTEGRDEKNVDNGSIVRMKESGPSKTQGLFCNIFCRPTGMAAVKKKKKKKKN